MWNSCYDKAWVPRSIWSYRHAHVHIYLLCRLSSCWQTLAHRVFSNLSCDWSCRASSAVLIWLMSTPAEFTLPSTASCSGISSVKSCAHNTDAVDYYWLIIYWFQVKIIDRSRWNLKISHSVVDTIQQQTLKFTFNLQVIFVQLHFLKKEKLCFTFRCCRCAPGSLSASFKVPSASFSHSSSSFWSKTNFCHLQLQSCQRLDAHRKMFIYNCAQCLKYAYKHTHIIPRVHIKHIQRQACRNAHTEKDSGTTLT